MITSPGTTPRAPFTRLLGALADADPTIVGSKAATLGRLRAAGFPVPDGFVLAGCSVSDLDGPGIRDLVDAALDQIGRGQVAVRSSSAAEDLAGASYAGQYDSVLGVEGLEDVLTAIRAVLESGTSRRVGGYRIGRGIDPAEAAMAVIVQSMVPAEAAGVAFTADPVTGDRGVVAVSAVRGLGDRLVSGEAGADEWVVSDGVATRRRGAEDVLDPANATAVAVLARRVEEHEGGPQDIEWAVAEGRIFLLQARPMTALPDAASWESPLPGSWSRDFRLGEWLGDPVTALFESWLLTRIEDSMHRFYGGLLGIELPRPAHVVVNGWYFYGLNFMPAKPAAMLAMMVRHVLPRLVLHPRRTAIAFPPLAHFSVSHYEAEWRAEVQPRYQRLAREAAAEVETATSDRLVALIDGLADAAGEYFTAATAVAGYASKAEIPLARFYTAYVAPKLGGSHLDLLGGLGTEVPTPASHAVRSLDWAEPTLGEMGAPRDASRANARHAEARVRRLDAEARARDALAADPKLLGQFERLLAEAQRYGGVREELIGEWTLPWPILRRAVLRLAADLVQRGAIERPEDVWFLRRDELLAGLDGGFALPPAVAAERRHTWEGQRRLVPPLRLGTMPPMMRRIVESAEDAIRGSTAHPADAPDAIVGIPASGGRASGPVRVLHSIDEFDRVQMGDVLVAPMTAPAWTPLFDRLAAIVTDTGGVAAHASIVAREYGLPAVVGTADATRRLRDGDMVEVDGSAGVVRRLGIVSGPGG
jgi:phosphohistidine swiveling domain-containing protein